MYTKHFLFDLQSIKHYAIDKLKLFDKNANLIVEEIGDGNINYVFRIEDKNTNKKVIIKQADKYLRSSQRLIDSKHNEVEANMLKFYNEHVLDFVPKLFHYDTIMLAIVMEDISDYKNLRYALLNQEIIPQLTYNIVSFIVNSTFITTDFVIDSFQKKRSIAKYINEEMCKITEDLVFTEPFNDYKGRNIILKENLSFVEKELYQNETVKLEALKLKYNFMNNPQALIHGDLHTASVFVKEDKIKVIDPEFAFFGPIGYDLGCIIANFFFALMYAYINAKEKQNFINWLRVTIKNTIEIFKAQFKQKYYELVSELYRNDNFFLWYLNNILQDAAGCVGLEIIRRIVGDSKVIDITSIEDRKARILSERILIKYGVNLIINRKEILDGNIYLKIFDDILKSSQVNEYLDANFAR